MEQFRVYLKAELGKLADGSDAACFLKSVSPEVLEKCRLALDVAALTLQFALQESVNRFVDILPDCCLRDLTRACDRDWRKNGVFDKLSSCDVWDRVHAAVQLVDVQQAEPRLAHLFRRNDFHLVRVACDPELWTNKPYCDWEPGREVAFKTCLARSSSARYTLFDGVHRAIQMVRNGERTIPTLYSKKWG